MKIWKSDTLTFLKWRNRWDKIWHEKQWGRDRGSSWNSWTFVSVVPSNTDTANFFKSFWVALFFCLPIFSSAAGKREVKEFEQLSVPPGPSSSHRLTTSPLTGTCQVRLEKWDRDIPISRSCCITVRCSGVTLTGGQLDGRLLLYLMGPRLRWWNAAQCSLQWSRRLSGKPFSLSHFQVGRRFLNFSLSKDLSAQAQLKVDVMYH